MSEQESERHDETWAYAGRRMHGDKVHFVWVDDAGKGAERWYSGKRPRATVGYLYTASVVRYMEDGRERVSLYGTPVLRGGSWSGPEGMDDPRPDWVASDNVVDQAQQRKRLENVAAKADTDLDRVIRPLLEVAAQLRTSTERDALTAYVIGRMNGVRYFGGKGHLL